MRIPTFRHICPPAHPPGVLQSRPHWLNLRPSHYHQLPHLTPTVVMIHFSPHLNHIQLPEMQPIISPRNLAKCLRSKLSNSDVTCTVSHRLAVTLWADQDEKNEPLEVMWNGDTCVSCSSGHYLRHVSLSVRPSVNMAHLECHWTDFYEIWYFGSFRKHVQKIQVSLKSDNSKW